MLNYAELLAKVTEFVKNKINSIRIPPLLSFFITKSGKINPALEESLKDAAPAGENWVRMALGKNSPIGIPYWVLFAIVIVFFFWEKFWMLISNLGMILVLGVVGYLILKSFKK
jgi:hypothetical protein